MDIVYALSAIWAVRQDNQSIPMVTRHTLREAQTVKRENENKHIHFGGTQILLVEDNNINQMVATSMLEKIWLSYHARRKW